MKSYKISSYNKFINESNEDIHYICQKYLIRNYTINGDGTVDVNGNVRLATANAFDSELKRIPLRFGKVTGDFYCSKNKLTSLEGAPKEVGGSFYCSSNQLTSLEGCPYKVGGSFFCPDNQLTSLEGSPSEVGRAFDCSFNQLINLKGCPQNIGSVFKCAHNELTSLEGMPKKLVSDFQCSHNKLSDVKVFPETGGYIYIAGNPVEEIFKLFQEARFNVDGHDIKEVIELLQEYEVIRDGNKVVLQALELVYDDLGLEVPEELNIEGYEII